MRDARLDGLVKSDSESNQASKFLKSLSSGLFKLYSLLSSTLFKLHRTMPSSRRDSDVKVRRASSKLAGSYNHNVACWMARRYLAAMLELASAHGFLKAMMVHGVCSQSAGELFILSPASCARKA